MTMGTYIKHLREQAGISQEELGKSLNPPVNRAAVNKWETGQVENIKRTHIQQLANKFGVTPCELMCFDSKFDTPRLAEEVKAIELVQKHFGMDAVRMLQYFQELNHTGKEKALEDLGDLVQLSKYASGNGVVKYNVCDSLSDAKAYAFDVCREEVKVESLEYQPIYEPNFVYEITPIDLTAVGNVVIGIVIIGGIVYFAAPAAGAAGGGYVLYQALQYA